MLCLQAYAPELYLLEATPEVRQAIAASSEGSTRPATRTSYDYDYHNRQSEYMMALLLMLNMSMVIRDTQCLLFLGARAIFSCHL